MLRAVWHVVGVVVELTVEGAFLVSINVEKSKPNSDGICHWFIISDLLEEVLAGDDYDLDKGDATLAFTSMLPYLMLTRQGFTLIRDFSKGKIVLLVVPSRSSMRIVDCPL